MSSFPYTKTHRKTHTRTHTNTLLRIHHLKLNSWGNVPDDGVIGGPRTGLRWGTQDTGWVAQRDHWPIEEDIWPLFFIRARPWGQTIRQQCIINCVLSLLCPRLPLSAVAHHLWALSPPAAGTSVLLSDTASLVCMNPQETDSLRDDKCYFKDVKRSAL